MAPKLRAPSHIDSAPTPLFAMYWYADPADGTSIVAACGGGGSAATGVKNLLTVRFGLRDDVDPISVPTGDRVGTSVYIAKNPTTNKVSLFCAMGSKVCVYSILPEEGQVVLKQSVEIGDNVNAVVANSLVDRIAVGCESGTVKVYEIPQDYQVEELALYTCHGHAKAVCAVSFATRSNLIASGAKDGQARVWNQDNCVAVLTHTINDPSVPNLPNRAILVRGCGFGDLDGKVVLSVASGKRGKAFLYKWGLDEAGNGYQCIERTECSKHPISSMSISGDAAAIALGATDGTVHLWNVPKWKAVKSFPEVHDLPVTCVAARPFDVPLQGEEQSLVMYNAISASADSRMGWLTLQRRNPKGSGARAGSGFPMAKYVNLLVKVALMYWLVSPVARDMLETCGGGDLPGIGSKLQCIRDDILIAPMSRPGIAVPPH